MPDTRPLHRLFGLTWVDFFDGTTVEVETELDLSLKQQFIDVVLVRRGNEPIPRRLPDGFEELAARNLVTFKSHQEALDAWALWELVGHFVNYRKQSSPSMSKLLPESDYALFAVCARHPQSLSQRMTLTPLRPGVYEVRELGLRIRVIVAGELPLAEQNAMLHLFSAREELLRYGREHYRPHSDETSTALYGLLGFPSEDGDMADKRLVEAAREVRERLLKDLTPAELSKLFPPEDRLKGLSADEVLKGMKGLAPETLEAILRHLKTNGASSMSP